MSHMINFPSSQIINPVLTKLFQSFLPLKMNSAQVDETSVTKNSSFKNYTHPDDHTIRTTDTPGFKPFTTNNKCKYQSPVSLGLIMTNSSYWYHTIHNIALIL